MDGVLVVVAKAAGPFEGVAVMVEVGVYGFLVSLGVGEEIEVVGEGMALARATLSRRSWRMALRCLRCSLSRRDTLEAALSWCCTKAGDEREGRSIAQRREVGSGPMAEDSVDVDIVVGRKRDDYQKNTLVGRPLGLR